MLGGLYNPDILSLAAGLTNTRLENPMGTVRKVSKLCGSWLEIDVNLQGGVVSDCALRVQACALGQASAGVLQGSIMGASFEELENALLGLRAMLKDDGAPPTGRFGRLALLEGVRAYPARHASTLLAFEAAVEAVKDAQQEES